MKAQEKYEDLRRLMTPGETAKSPDNLPASKHNMQHEAEAAIM